MDRTGIPTDVQLGDIFGFTLRLSGYSHIWVGLTISIVDGLVLTVRFSSHLGHSKHFTLFFSHSPFHTH